MKKFFKTVLFLGGTALAGYLGYKEYKKISGLTKLQKSLPEFLNNVYGEKPSTKMMKAFNTLKIKVGFPQEILDKHSDIETTVREYVEDFYPELAKGALEIEVGIKCEDTEEECCCGGENHDEEGNCDKENCDEDCCKDKE
ncbi:MAG: hypothetical protein PHI68_01800 [Candidatus Cloacimonetes bacterium]|jgi:hypothetical protein|nr:hypothetical protein [Candidatus Cloacimonadota bacterium]